MRTSVVTTTLFLGFAALAGALVSPEAAAPQQAPPPRPPGVVTGRPAPPAKPAPVEKLGPDLVRIGNVTVNTATKEVSAPGVIIPGPTTYEFIAVTKGGGRSYESVIELDTNAINFNLGLILIGLDAARAKRPSRHLDPNPPSGDPVEVWVEWTDSAKGTRRVRAEELILNTVEKQTLSEGPWVYTGSVVTPSGAFLADVEGPLIGFVHTPATVIDSPRALGKGAYGSNRFNTALDLKPATPVKLTVRALPRPGSAR